MVFWGEGGGAWIQFIPLGCGRGGRGVSDRGEREVGKGVQDGKKGARAGGEWGTYLVWIEVGMARDFGIGEKVLVPFRGDGGSGELRAVERVL